MMNSKKYDGTETRLAASDVNSMASLQIMNNEPENEAFVKQRLITTYNLSHAEVSDAYDRLINCIKNAELTINFQPEDWFAPHPGTVINNAFQRPKAANYMADRDHVEEDMFKYSNIQSSNFNVQQASSRIASKGQFDSGKNVSFDPNMRPRYGSLNIFNMITGGAGASTYGKSHFVLKEYMKHRCTFTYWDSFRLEERNRAEHLANIFYPARILRDMSDYSFNVLYSRSKDDKTKHLDLSHHRYIEAQIHNEIHFDRDVLKICLSREEIRRYGTKTAAQLTKRIESFARKNRITVEYF